MYAVIHFTIMFVVPVKLSAPTLKYLVLTSQRNLFYVAKDVFVILFLGTSQFSASTLLIIIILIYIRHREDGGNSKN